MSPTIPRLRIPFCLLLALSLSGALVPAPLRSSPPQTASGKQDYALIFGTVWGPDSRPIAGVLIRIRRASDKKFRWERTSDRRGEFAQRVPVGTQDYVIQADTGAAKGTPKAQVTVHIDGNARKDVGIRLSDQQLPH